jgi:catalase
MPLPDDPQLIALSEELLKQFESIFGMHPGFRPAHAKGAILTGTFSPAPGAAALTRAPHVQQKSTRVSVRFSNSTGLPLIPDNNPNANPHGIAIRFHLGEHIHTDIIGHSTDGFPTHTGEEFLEFLRAVAASVPSKPSPSPIEVYLGSHPAALAFVQASKPIPSSFAQQTYFGVTAMRFENREGVAHYGRYRIVPEAGNDHLSEADAAARGENFLFDELKERVSSGPISFRILVQVAGSEDTVDDATVHWPEERPLADFGTIVLDSLAADNAALQRQTIFDPIPRVDGIEPSKDPVLELRAAVYLISGRRRRAAG